MALDVEGIVDMNFQGFLQEVLGHVLPVLPGVHVKYLSERLMRS